MSGAKGRRAPDKSGVLPPLDVPSTPSKKDRRSSKDAGSDATTERDRGSTKTLVEMEDELLEANRELELREDYLRGVQRNYEALAKMCNKNMQVIADLKTELETSKNQVKTLRNEEAKYNERKEAMQRLQQDNDTFRQRQTEGEEHNNKLSQRCYEYQTHIADLNEMKDELNSQFMRVQGLAQSRKEEVLELQEALKQRDARDNVEEISQHNRELQVSLSEAIEEAQYQKDSQAKTAIQLQKSQNLVRRMEMDRDNGAGDVARLRKSHAGAKKELTELKLEIEEERHKNESLALDTHALKSQIKMLGRSGPELMEKLSFSEKAREALQKQFDTIFREREETGALLGEAMQKITMLKKQLAEQVNARASDKEYFQRLQGSQKGKDEIAQNNYALTTKNKELETQIKDCNVEIQSLIQKNQTLRKNKEFMQSQIDSFEKEREETTVVQGDGEEQTEETQVTIKPIPGSDLERAKTKVRELETMLHDKDNVLAEVKHSYENSRNETERAQEALNAAQQAHAREKQENAARADTELNLRLEGLQKQISELNSALLLEQHKTAELKAVLDGGGGADKAKLPPDAEELARRDKELMGTIAKIVVSEEATEASFTCIQCVRLYDDAVTCVPCGHSYCKGCVEKKGYCTQCGPATKVSYYPNELLADLTAKYTFRKQALAGLKRVLSASQ